MYNLNKISDAPSADVEIKDPETGAPLGVFFTMAGPEHPKRKAIEFARQRKIRAALQKTGKIELNDPEDDEQATADTLVACTLGWRGYSNDAGAEVTFTPQAASTLFNDDTKGWLRHQLVTAMNERERFIKRSATT
jgi:hypothetical protein